MIGEAHLFHGFNVWDGGTGSIVRWTPHLDRHGVPWEVHDSGWTGPLLLRFYNRQVVRETLPTLAPGAILAGHSNGALICWQLVEAGAAPAAVILFQPALRRDTPWPRDLPVLCIYNRRDLAVQAGRAWARFASVATGRRHGWGAAGRYGFTLPDQPYVENHRTDDHPLHPVTGHSAIFGRATGLHHLDYAARWAAHTAAKWRATPCHAH